VVRLDQNFEQVRIERSGCLERIESLVNGGYLGERDLRCSGSLYEFCQFGLFDVYFADVVHQFLRAFLYDDV
jgi:hypothetical protein